MKAAWQHLLHALLHRRHLLIVELSSYCRQVIESSSQVIKSSLSSCQVVVVVGGVDVDVGRTCACACMVRDGKWLCVGVTHHVCRHLSSLVVSVVLWEGGGSG